MPTSNAVLDDRLLVALLVGAPVRLPRRVALHTTALWYYRACRAAIAGGRGRLSGPFRALPPDQQAQAIQGLLVPPHRVALPDSRALVPEMAAVALRHPQLNLLNVEAAATARLLGATVLLSPPAARGILPGVLDAEDCRWDTLTP